MIMVDLMCNNQKYNSKSEDDYGLKGKNKWLFFTFLLLFLFLFPWNKASLFFSNTIWLCFCILNSLHKLFTKKLLEAYHWWINRQIKIPSNFIGKQGKINKHEIYHPHLSFSLLIMNILPSLQDKRCSDQRKLNIIFN